ncbi:MAG: ATP-dependent DNA helicase [Candidatus Bilamarchaeaceae archaeon]
MSPVYFRHEQVRKEQDALIRDAYEAIECGKHLIAHAPVGMGKSDALLSPAISYALEHNQTVFFLTPKISQHKIALSVAKGLAQKYKLPIRAVDLIGRRHACIDPVLSDADHESFYTTCERKRKKEQCQFYKNAKGFSRLEEAKAELLFKKVLDGYGSGKSHDEIIQLGKEKEACPYEWLIKLASTSNVIIADYYHMMLPQIRDILLLKTKKNMSNSIIIVDEAHNLSKRVRDQLSTSTNTMLLRKLDKEYHFLGMKTNFESKFNSWAKGMLGKCDEKVVSQEAFLPAISNQEFSPLELADHLLSAGTTFIEATGKKSYCMRFSSFLERWLDEKDKTPSVRILKRKGQYYYLSKKALDPSGATSKLNEAHSALLTSGTLLPLEMHRDVLGLDPKRTMMKQYASPFPEENRVNILLEGFTTKYSRRDPGEYTKIAEMLDKIIASTPGGTALFFPSYVVMNAVLPFLKSAPLLVQKEKMKPSEIGELLKEFRTRGTLCCVQGGSLAEGVDYAHEEIKTAVIIGIALEEMNLEIEALIEHFDSKFGRGWDYGYLYPAVIKAVQSAGRAIRKESDRAVLIYMDDRFRWKNYRPLLPKEERFISTSDPIPYIENFWKK